MSVKGPISQISRHDSNLKNYVLSISIFIKNIDYLFCGPLSVSGKNQITFLNDFISTNLIKVARSTNSNFIYKKASFLKSTEEGKRVQMFHSVHRIDCKNNVTYIFNNFL